MAAVIARGLQEPVCFVVDFVVGFRDLRKTIKEEQRWNSFFYKRHDAASATNRLSYRTMDLDVA